MATLEREDRLKAEEFKRAKRALPRLQRRADVLFRKTTTVHPRGCLEEQDELRQLQRDIHNIETDRAQTDYLCNLSSLLRTHTEEVNQQKTVASRQWEEEMVGQSLAIHERQKCAGNVLWNRHITIRFVGEGLSAIYGQSYKVHVNTTLPQLSQMVHQISLPTQTDDYFPLTYNFWIVNPTLRDPFRSRTILEWIGLLDKRRDAYDEMLPIQTSIGETLYYDGHTSLETYIDNLQIPFLCILMAPRTTAEWRIPQRANANLQRVDQYVSSQRQQASNIFSQKGALYQKYMEMIGKKEPSRVHEATGICTDCQVNMVKIESESKMVCSHCGLTEEYLDNSTRNLPFGHEINATSSTYKRINRGFYMFIVVCTLVIWFYKKLIFLNALYYRFQRMALSTTSQGAYRDT